MAGAVGPVPLGGDVGLDGPERAFVACSVESVGNSIASIAFEVFFLAERWVKSIIAASSNSKT